MELAKMLVFRYGLTFTKRTTDGDKLVADDENTEYAWVKLAYDDKEMYMTEQEFDRLVMSLKEELVARGEIRLTK